MGKHAIFLYTTIIFPGCFYFLPTHDYKISYLLHFQRIIVSRSFPKSAARLFINSASEGGTPVLIILNRSGSNRAQMMEHYCQVIICHSLVLLLRSPPLISPVSLVNRANTF